LRSPLRSLFAPGRIPWTFLAVGLAATVIQLHLGWREALVYQRDALAEGEWWRIWTGQLVHFGWPHFVADAGLFLILGRLLEWQYPWASRFSLVVMPLVITATLYCCDRSMLRYGGLSAVNLGLLVFLACQGWQKNWFDWFWPAVLAIYVGEVVLESTVGHGHGGGMIQFDDPSVHVATDAHIASAVFGVVLWQVVRRRTAAGRRI
jgi:rhomboid family GlyGly-CTERM serine protease